MFEHLDYTCKYVITFPSLQIRNLARMTTRPTDVNEKVYLSMSNFYFKLVKISLVMQHLYISELNCTFFHKLLLLS